MQSYQPASLFAAKLHAVLFRKYEKGRDYYDLLWFLTRDIPINYGLLTNAAAQTEQDASVFDAKNTKERLLARIAGVNFTSLLNDARLKKTTDRLTACYSMIK